MAVMHCNFFSRYLSYDTQVNVILPENRAPYQFDDTKPYRYQVLYLLHGRGDDCNGWMRCSNIERFASEHRIAVVMPSGEDSFYLNSADGKEYFSYMTEELPAKLAQWFPISDRPEDTFIAGLSMGGYGTLKIGLTYPERFAGMALLSPVTEPEGLYGIFDNELDNRLMAANMVRTFGKEVKKEDDPISLLENCMKEGKKMPMILHYEGAQDLLYEMNQSFLKRAKELGTDISYEEWDGEHDWTFWNEAIQKVLNNLPINNDVIHVA